MNRLLRMSAGPLAGLSMAGLLAAPAAAQDYDVKSLQGHTPSTTELIESLTPGEQTSGGMRFRGVRPVEASKPKAVSLTVQFEFGSAALNPDARQVLDNLGAALKSPKLSGDTFLIEGHTDSVGSEEYNQRLSEMRARSVKQYLSTESGVEPDRLRTVGKGESNPIDRGKSEAGVNRRVQVINLR